MTDKTASPFPKGAPARFGPWRLGVLSNPLSGANRRGLGPVRSILGRFPAVAHREVRTAEQVGAALLDFAREGVNLVAVNSGDGTVQAVLTALLVHRPFQHLPVLALLSGGTTNMTSHELGLRGGRLAALRRLLDWVHHGDGAAEFVARSVLKIHHPLRPEPICGMFFGAACIEKGIRFFHARVHQLGLSGDPAHLLIVARFLMALASRDDALVAPAAAAIRADGRLIGQGDTLLLMVSTLERLILGLRPFWGRGHGPLKLTAVGAAPRRILGALPAFVSGRATPGAQPANGYLSVSAQRIELALKGGFAVDGELFTSDPSHGPLVIEDGGRACFLKV